MTKKSPLLEICKQEIEEVLNWGESSQWKTKDFETLNEMIHDKTGISLSVSTLRRIWGHTKYESLPTLTTLDALSRFIDYPSWREYSAHHSKKEDTSPTGRPIGSAKPDNKRVFRSLLILFGLIGISLVVYSYIQSRPGITDVNYELDIKKVGESLPSSVIFSYRSKEKVDNDVYFQQSWDNSKRVRINAESKTLTSIYQYPGVHIAKVIVGDNVVCKKPVVIPTKGWVGIVENGESPIYLDKGDFLSDSLITLTESRIKTFSVNMETDPRLIQFYNVGNFDPFDLADFSFSTQIRHDFQKGASACQFTYIAFYTDRGVILIPMSQAGCVAKLTLINHDEVMYGAENDLSDLGLDISKWTKVDIRNVNDKISVYYNGTSKLEIPVIDRNTKLYGFGVFFKGTGSLKSLTLKNGKNTVFTDL
ncbi:hypothetical protein [Sphingobacterium thalpophilum]|uniref:hypothetical protein n=1 Tax=Sphingobacterium thalpophilum TaxID=259 RepID=UPI003C75B982